MNDDSILNLNVNQMLRCLAPILDRAEMEKVRAEVKQHAAKLIRLGESHLRAAKRAEGNGAWRQRVSRGYYTCYAASRAIRLSVFGFYTTKSDDHKKVGSLPDDFPRKSIWENRLTQFRGDRNLADYDHTATNIALERTSSEYLKMADEFLAAAKDYLRTRGDL